MISQWGVAVENPCSGFYENLGCLSCPPVRKFVVLSSALEWTVGPEIQRHVPPAAQKLMGLSVWSGDHGIMCLGQSLLMKIMFHTSMVSQATFPRLRIDFPLIYFCLFRDLFEAVWTGQNSISSSTTHLTRKTLRSLDSSCIQFLLICCF